MREVCVPRDGWICSCVVLGGAGQIFFAEAEGEQLGLGCEESEVCAVVHVQPVRTARLPRRRALCARVGVLEDVLGAARRRTGLRFVDRTCLGTVYTRQAKLRTPCPCKRPSGLFCGGLAHQQIAYSACRAILRCRMKILDGSKMPYS